MSKKDPTIYDLSTPMNDFGKRACQHGHDSEDYNAHVYARMMNVQTARPELDQIDHLNQKGMIWLEGDTYWQHIEFPFFYGVSPDRELWQLGRNLGADPQMIGFLEIKSPWGGIYREPKPAHIAQCMMQMWVARRTSPHLRFCDYFVGKLDQRDHGNKDVAKFLLVRFYYTKEYVRWMKARLYHFSSCLWRTMWSKTIPRTRYEPDEEWIKSENPPPIRLQVLYPQCPSCNILRLQQRAQINLLLLAHFKGEATNLFHFTILPFDLFKIIVTRLKGILVCKRCEKDPFEYPAQVNGLSKNTTAPKNPWIKKIKTEED